MVGIIITENTVGLFMNGFLEAPLLIIALGTPILWFVNYFIAWSEHLIKPRLRDHFQLSAFYYLTSIYYGLTFLKYGYHGGLGEAYGVLILAISIWAIVINAMFLYRRIKSKTS